MKMKGGFEGSLKLDTEDVVNLMASLFSPACTNRPNLFCNTSEFLGAESLAGHGLIFLTILTLIFKSKITANVLFSW